MIRHPGNLDDAIDFACGANAANGLRRTNADKRLAIRVAIERRPAASDNEIARRVAVSVATVGAVRRILSNLDSIETPAERTFIHHKTGRLTTMDVSRIGRASTV